MSAKKDELEKRLARLLANTLRTKRPHPITVIANDIIFLKNELSSLKEVSERVGISVEMLRRFLCVNNLNPKVKQLVKKRDIDSVEMVNHLCSFDNDSQIVITQDIIEGRLAASDIKVLRSYKNRYPDLKIKKLIGRVIDSKDKTDFVLYFHVPIDIQPAKILKKFHELLGKKEIVFFEPSRIICKIKLTKVGLKRIRKEAKGKKLDLRKYIEKYIVEKSGVNII